MRSENNSTGSYDLAESCSSDTATQDMSGHFRTYAGWISVWLMAAASGAMGAIQCGCEALRYWDDRGVGGNRRRKIEHELHAGLR